MRGFMRRTPTCALHVHVGMPDPESAIRACTGLRVLPAGAAGPGGALALLARPGLRLRERPRAALPRLPARRDPARVRRLGGLRGLRRRVARGRRRARLHVPVVGHPPAPAAGHRRVPRDGRAVPARLRRRAWRRSCTGSRSRVLDGRADPPVPGAEIAEGSFRAGRDGLDATLRWDGAMRPLRDLAAEAIGHARGALRERGADGALEHAERILREGNGADRDARRARRRAGCAPCSSGSSRTRLRPSEARCAARSARRSPRRRTTPRSSARSPAAAPSSARRRARASC